MCIRDRSTGIHNTKMSPLHGFQQEDDAGHLQVAIFALFKEDDHAAAHASATCRSWHTLVQQSFPMRFSAVVDQVVSFIEKLPRFEGCTEAVTRGRSEEALQAAEACLKRLSLIHISEPTRPY
eukprot:TRINITY_DN15700_c0_g2_i1.p1 TRINITY_DN15700_c0_g2~~TRINITY_DN15700_c0_g2_i1.p1  ORF type:complete len:123 (-),score=24.33 TRINITY_DN15700_c0_g2_i1:75-443(-)